MTFLDLDTLHPILSQLCGYETTSPEYLKIHEKTHNNNSFKCDCGRVFKEEYQLVRHKKQDHSNQKVCQWPWLMDFIIWFLSYGSYDMVHISEKVIHLTSVKISLNFSLQVKKRWMHSDKNFKIDLDFHQGKENQVENVKDRENLHWKIYLELI